MPTLSGRACATEIQNASSVCALSVRPESKIVTEIISDGEERGFGIERVENRLDEQHIGAALEQPERLLAIGVHELDIGHAARAGIVRVARDGGGAVGWSHRSGDEADAPRVRRHELVAYATGQPRGLDVQLGDDRFEVIVGLRNGLRVERIGLDDVGARLEKAAMNFRDDVGPREHEQIAVALEILVMFREPLAAKISLLELILLQCRAHRAVDDDDAFLQ